ncbi:MAG: hypothetical protein ACSHXK_06835 [Oceanococcus sp.]
MNKYRAALGVFNSALVVGMCIPFASAASEAGFSGMAPSLNLRLRFETAEQSNALKDARAFTLRHRIGIKTPDWYGVQIFAETEGVHALATEQYNSGPGGNGRSNYTVIADPTNDELNQFWLNWQTSDNSELRLGRQRLIYGNARFLGNVGWRQNEQTYDALSMSVELGNSVALNYAYLAQVNRIFFDQRELQGHALHVASSASDVLKPYAFAYLLDFENGQDNQTLGVGANGSWPLSGATLSYSLAYAKQQDYAEAASLDADYLHVEIAAGRDGWKAALGIETLGGDGQQSFSTPLATLHKFNGWADVFLSTPADGLRDSYAKLGYAKGGWSSLLMYHQFSADQGSADFGSEIDLLLSWKCAKGQVLKFKYADYNSDGYAVDTQRLTLEWNYKIAG